MDVTKLIEFVKGLLARGLVILKAAPTWLTVVALSAPIIAEEVAAVLPAPWSERATALALTVVGVATALINTIRRLTPVVAGDRGLLPNE